MFTLDGTDTTWLIYADWLDDNGNYQQAELVREEVLEENNYWCYESFAGVKRIGGKHDNGVGYLNREVGDIENNLGGDTDVGCGVGGGYFYGGLSVGGDR